MLYLIVLLAFVFFAAVAMCVNEGLWNNTITLIGILLSGISAFLFGAPLGVYVAEQAEPGDDKLWAVIFCVVWATFALSIVIFKLLSEKISQVRMKFIPQFDMVAGPLMGLFLALFFTSFAALTLLRIPIQAGQWDIAKAAPWQKQAFLTISSPFHTIVKRAAQADGAESSLLGK